MIRTAILGYGRSGSTMHAGGVEHNPAMEMAAVCDVDPERRQQAHERFGCPTYDDYHEMLAHEDLDLVCVITRSHQHCRMACDCLKAGVNVLVTKPWAVNEGEALEMIRTARDTGKQLLPWLPARWGCDVKRLRQLIVDERAIGSVFLIRRAVTSFATRCDWQTERQYGGGYLLNWGMHIVDPPLLLADAEVATVYARMKQTINPGDTEDVFLALMTLTDGTVVQAEYTVAVEELPSWFIQGDRGTIVMRDHALKLYKNTPAQPGDPTHYGTMQSADEEVIEENVAGELYGDTDEVYAEIAAGLLGQRPYPVTVADALEGSRILDAIRTADADNRVVTLSTQHDAEGASP